MTDPATLVRTMFAAIDKGDGAAVAATLAEKARFYFNGAETPMDMATFVAMGEDFNRAFSNARHIIEHQISAGEWAATRLTWTAMHTAPFNGVPATHRPVRIGAMGFDRAQDGRLVERHVLIDIAALMSQIGAVTEPA